MAEREGITLSEFFDDETKEGLKAYDVIVGHNLDFDLHVLKSDLLRNNIEIDFFPGVEFCTMMNGCGLRSMKAPKLTELYEHLYKKKLQQTHKAIDDAQAAYAIKR
jgi:DNA polymerase III alpha subunit (gram-positive type)